MKGILFTAISLIVVITFLGISGIIENNKTKIFREEIRIRNEIVEEKIIKIDIINQRLDNLDLDGIDVSAELDCIKKDLDYIFGVGGPCEKSFPGD